MKNRFKESIRPILTEKLIKNNPLIILSPSDRGVRRNQGRNGARFAPQAIIGTFAKLQNHLLVKKINLKIVTEQSLEDRDFEASQKLQANEIKDAYAATSPSHIVHIGGGHDHIYPLLSGLEDFFERIVIINFDAHSDTRNDTDPHSGTPFRNFDHNSQTETKLLQVGVHLYANSTTTLSPLQNIAQTFVYKNNESDLGLLAQVKKYLDQVTVNEKTLIVISLDCDGLAAAEMEAVSAVNHNGFGSSLVRETIKYLSQLPKQPVTAFGLYEYNPLYDNLSQKGARLCAGLIYDFFAGSLK